MTQASGESSVLFSLAELNRIEQERVAAEAIHAQVARERCEREQREAEISRKQLEQARLASERQAEVDRVRREEQANARETARKSAVLETARIEAEAKIRFAAEERAREHELALLRIRLETTSHRLSQSLAIALGLVICLAAVVGLVQRGQRIDLEGEAARSHLQLSAISAERDTLTRKVAALTATVEQLESRVREQERGAAPRQSRDSAPGSLNRTANPTAKHSPPPTTTAAGCVEGDPMCDTSGKPISGG
ncbi:MAG TPA: hypothetical protein VL137_06185 [Polyangiaceae bacterium]|jgi:hypothetical protein|nr:hypothetical protein [Polyangiaceae bacterium]